MTDLGRSDTVTFSNEATGHRRIVVIDQHYSEITFENRYNPTFS
jgi:hypothetical protein